MVDDREENIQQQKILIHSIALLTEWYRRMIARTLRRPPLTKKSISIQGLGIKDPLCTYNGREDDTNTCKRKVDKYYELTECTEIYCDYRRTDGY